MLYNIGISEFFTERRFTVKMKTYKTRYALHIHSNSDSEIKKNPEL